MFAKRVDIFKKRDRDTWKEIKRVLKENGVKGVRSGHYLQDTVMAGGCGAKLDPRDFGAKGKIDREIYWIEVRESDEPAVHEILLKNGLQAGVDEDLMVDAALRKRPGSDMYFK